MDPEVISIVEPVKFLFLQGAEVCPGCDNTGPGCDCYGTSCDCDGTPCNIQ